MGEWQVSPTRCLSSPGSLMLIKVRLVLVYHHEEGRRRKLLLSLESLRTVADSLLEVVAKFERRSRRYCRATIDGYSLPLDELVGNLIAESDCLKLHLFLTEPADFDPTTDAVIPCPSDAGPRDERPPLGVDDAWENVSAGDLISYRLPWAVGETLEVCSFS